MEIRLLSAKKKKNHALCDTSMKLGTIAELYELNIS